MPKYKSYADLVQAVSQVRDTSLTQGECLFLAVLAAHSVKGNPHPGNERLRIGCRVTTVRAVQKIAEKLIHKRLIEVVQRGDGRGNATVYKIRVDDDRFPPAKPRTPEDMVSQCKPRTLEDIVLDDKQRTDEPETANSHTENHELEAEKPRTLEDTTNLKERITRTNTRTSAADAAVVPEASLSLPSWLPVPEWSTYLKWRKSQKLPSDVRIQELLIKRLADLRNNGSDPRRVIENSIVNAWKSFFPLTEVTENRTERNARIAGLTRKKEN